MNGPAIQKICRLCAQSCAARPRVKDQHGRYFCRECYDRAIARKRAREALAAASISAAVSEPEPAPQPPVRASAYSSPAALPHAPSLALPPALPRTPKPPPRAVSASTPIIVPILPAIPIGPERQLIAEPAGSPLPPPPPLPPPEPPAPRVERFEAITFEPSSFELAPERSDWSFEEPIPVPALADGPSPEKSQGLNDHFNLEAVDTGRSVPTADVAATFAPAPVEAPPSEPEPQREMASPAAFTSDDASALDIPRVRSARSLLLDDEPPPVAFAACPHCSRPVPTGAIVCLACGYNLITREISHDDTDRPPPRPRPRSGWAGPLLMSAALTLAALAGGYLLFGTRQGLMVFAIAFLIAAPAWFIWALIDAGNTERAQLKIWLVPGYVFAWIYGHSRSRYLRAATIAVATIAIVLAAMGYQWRTLERQRQRALIDERARASMPG